MKINHTTITANKALHSHLLRGMCASMSKTHMKLLQLYLPFPSNSLSNTIKKDSKDNTTTFLRTAFLATSKKIWHAKT